LWQWFFGLFKRTLPDTLFFFFFRSVFFLVLPKSCHCYCSYLMYIMDQVMGTYGYSIEHILMVDIIPDDTVRKAMNEINAGTHLLYILPLLYCIKLFSI
jgi:hypothetical protein